MLKYTFLFLLLISSLGYSQNLENFYDYNPELEQRVDQVFSSLSDTSRIGQMLIQATGRLGKPKKEIIDLIENNKIGGILLLNGEKEQFRSWVEEFNILAKKSGTLPLIYSADAEPSLINRKIKGSHFVPKTNQLETTEDVERVSALINQDLNFIGIQHNYSPVVDLSPDNAAIRNRSFGSDPDSVIRLSRALIASSQQANIVATAKHFPGHGLVSGDTHKQLVSINGEMKELSLYDSLIRSGVISIMVGHIAVLNNEHFSSNGLPASCSRVIVTDLLKNSMGFRGIIITDALNMGALDQLDNAPLMAAKAGSDMILMPKNSEDFIDSVLSEIEKDPDFRNQVYTSVKKIIRTKILLGLMDTK